MPENLKVRDVGVGVFWGLIGGAVIGPQLPSAIMKTFGGYVPTEGVAYVTPEEVGISILTTFVAGLFIGTFYSHYRRTMLS